MANSPQTGTQTKESKLRFKITVNMLRISQCPWAACKTWSSNEFFSAAVLKQRKKASVKNPNTEADRYLLHCFGKNSNSPPPGTQMAFGVFQSSKKRTILTNVCLFNGSHGFLHFFTRFSTQKVYFNSETTCTPLGLPKRNLQECRANFSKICLLCFIKAVK